MLSKMSIPVVLALLGLSFTGPGDCGRSKPVDSAGSGTVPLCERRGAPHISHERREGWFEKVHRGQGKLGASVGPGPACGLEVRSGVDESLKDSDNGLDSEGFGLLGNALVLGLAGGRLLELVIDAFSTWDKDGLIPQARQGGRGVCAFAAAGSKFEGTGFEKLQIVQTHVAEEAGLGPGGFRGEPSCRGELEEVP